MLEIGVPVYKARDTLPKGLDSLVAQTRNNFTVCLSIDADGEDYSDIVETYTARGLTIRVIEAEENGGPGMARQHILDTTEADYIMFMDADDMLMPRAVELLYIQAKIQNLDIVRSSFVREERKGGDRYITKDVNTITWFHGKIYRVGYLKEKNIRFLPGLRTDEDAYFNFIAWNSTKNRGELNEMTYIWRDNPNSVTRCNSVREYFSNTYNNYIRSQVEGLKKLFELNKDINYSLVSQTLMNLYYYYMNAKFLNLPLDETEAMFMSLADEPWMPTFLNTPQNWMEIVQNVKAGAIYEGQYVVFYNETFYNWAMRLFKKYE